MAKRKLTRRQAWRIEKIQAERSERASKRDTAAGTQLNEGDLGEEQHGLVIAHYGTQVDIEGIELNNHDDGSSTETFSGNTKRCHFRANLGSLVTGDRVIWRDGKPNGVIVATEPRHSALSRPDPYGDVKTVAANIDRIIIVIAPYPEIHADLVDRYLIAAENLDIQPIILLNKQDRINDDNREFLTTLQATYQDLGYQFLTASTVDSSGLSELTRYLADYTSVFVGQSGVGKSSLVNALLPEANLRIGPLSEQSQKGTHTTTTAQLFHFPGGGNLIDSPGIREFGLWNMHPQQLIEGFVEFRPFLGYCKFRDCAHQQEPGCAILKALDDGDISAARMTSYRQILSTLEEPKN